MKTLVSILLSFCFLSLHAQKEYLITGRVTESKNNEPLAFVNVYVQSSTMGTTTDENGNFQLAVSEGKYRLVASMVGYVPEIKSIVINKDISGVEFSLNLDIQQFDEIEVTGRRDRNWDRNIKVFLKEFLGKEYKRQGIVLKNREVVSFEEKNGTLIAFANEPLLIENNFLGYNVFFILQHFSISSNGIKMTGIPRFEKMNPNEESDKLKWHKNRKGIYLGSPKHFLRSYLTCILESQGFEVSYNLDKYKLPSRNALVRGEDSFNPTNPNVFVLDFPDWVTVTYWPLDDYSQRSTIKKLHDIEVDRMGNLLEPLSVEISGKMAEHRMGQLLPSDYELGF